MLGERIFGFVLVGGIHLGRVHEEGVSRVERCQIVLVAVEFFWESSVQLIDSDLEETYQLPCVSFGAGSLCST